MCSLSECWFSHGCHHSQGTRSMDNYPSLDWIHSQILLMLTGSSQVQWVWRPPRNGYDPERPRGWRSHLEWSKTTKYLPTKNRESLMRAVLVWVWTVPSKHSHNTKHSGTQHEAQWYTTSTPDIGEVMTGESLWVLGWSTQQGPRQPGLYNKTLSQTTTKQKDLHVEGLIPNAAVRKARTYVEGTHRKCVGAQVCEGLRSFSIALHLFEPESLAEPGPHLFT